MFVATSAGYIVGGVLCTEMGREQGRDDKFCFGHVGTSGPLRHPDGDTEEETGCAVDLKHKVEDWVGNTDLQVISRKVMIRSTGVSEITKGDEESGGRSLWKLNFLGTSFHILGPEQS